MTMPLDDGMSRSALPVLADINKATKDDLRRLIRTFPLVDNHAHNILLPENAYGSFEVPFESSISEAQGPALSEHIQTSLCFFRAQKQLARFFDCAESWPDIKAARSEWIRRDYEGFVRKSLEGIHSLLLDDGLNTDLLYPYRWHRKVVPECSRIVRIETVAAELLEELVPQFGLGGDGKECSWEKSQSESCFIRFNAAFRNQIRALANDPDVRGFKSVVCYRTGLDVGLDSRRVFRPQAFTLQDSDLLTGFHQYLQRAVRTNEFRIQTKAFNDYLVVAVCEVIDKRVEAEGEGLPIQFHCGFGDNDINLEKANPAYLQPLIEAYPNVDIVMLHGSYPYTREAGYLASVYPNAYLDIGGMFIILSRDAQETMLRQALELAPTSKIILSTDAHFFPETYWLGLKQIRESLEKVIVSYLEAGDFTTAQAINVVTDLLFWNSNKLYKLNEEREYPHLLQACGRSPEFPSPMVDGPDDGHPTRQVSNPSWGRSAEFLPMGRSADQASSHSAAVAAMESFLRGNTDIRYIWMQWIDYTNTTRCRMIPLQEFVESVRGQKRVGGTVALLHLLQRDFYGPAGTASGQFLFAFDTATLTRNVGLPAHAAPSATVQTFWHEDQAKTVAGAPHLEGCPRWTLQKQVEAAKDEFGISLLMGFEIEIIFMRPIKNADDGTIQSFEPITNLHSYANMTYAQLDVLPMIEEIVDGLASIDIHLPTFHSEAAPGQWEFVLPPFEPLKAVDTLYRARFVIGNVAKKYGLKATCYPRPFDFTCGSACHAHFSIDRDSLEYESSWLAGILEHLPSILAFSLPTEASFERVRGGIWSGGEWVAWGFQNKETPLRKIEDGRFEMKTVDGMSNGYLAMACVIAAGLHGVRERMALKQKECPYDASVISEEARAELGITTRLPNTLEKALKILEEDDALKERLGVKFVEIYVATKRAELDMFKAMDKEAARKFIMERY